MGRPDIEGLVNYFHGMTDLDLTHVLRHSPAATAYIGAYSEHPQAAAVTTTRWRNQRRQLQHLGTPVETLEAMDAVIGVDTAAVSAGPGEPDPSNVNRAGLDNLADHDGDDILAVVASGEAITAHTFIDANKAKGEVKFGPLPMMTPLLEAQQSWAPYLVAIVDRVGADIWGVADTGEALSGDSVDGTAFQITKVNTGGWSHKRIHTRAENRWAANAKDVAARLGELTRAHRPAAVFIAGDESAVGLVIDAVGGDVQPLVRRLAAGSRAEDGSDDAYAAEIHRQLDNLLAEQLREDLATLKERLAVGPTAVAGIHDVVDALQQARVDTLFLPRRPLQTELAFAEAPTSIAEAPEELALMGITGVEMDAASDVLARAALLTGATVRVAPAAAVPHGVAALLRG